MSDYPYFIFSTYILAIVQSATISWMVLKLICIARPNLLRALYISSSKSTTNARLLGGLSISVAVITAIASLIIFCPDAFSFLEKKTLYFALASIGLVTLYGYIDDKIEVRVRFKLIMQFSSVLSFAYFTAHNISPAHPIIAFLVSSVLGLALVNGTNLLDGLDTLSVKLGAVSSLAFLYLGFLAHSGPTIFLSIALLSALYMFYFFNREPAKVYMGEIGGSLIGLIYFIQSSYCFTELQNHMPSSHALALVLTSSFFPICELAVSFIRRLIGKKSPFLGDKLHLHYVLKNRYQLTATQVSTRMGIAAVLILTLGYIITQKYNPIVGFAFVTIVTLQTYTMVCFEEWRSSHLSETPEYILKLFEGKTVTIIDSTRLGSLDISLNDKEDKKALST